MTSDIPGKVALRAAMRRVRRALAEEFPDAARQAASHFPIESIGALGSVAGYHPLGAELDPRALLSRLAEAGLAVALPVALARDAPLIFRVGPNETPDAFGVPSPGPSAPQVQPDLVIAPVLAFDRFGGRLGQGGGTYDRTLAGLRARRDVLVVGLAYAGQEVERVPGEAHDQRLDAILTEKGYTRVRKDI